MMHLYTMNPDGTQVKRVTEGAAVEPEGVFSPDGKRIAFTLADPKSNRADLYLMNADGTGKRLLQAGSPRSQVFSPSWSPDGKQLAYSILEKPLGKPGKASLWRIGADGKNARRLGEGLIPVWSPEGITLLFTRYDTGAKGEPALWTMDADGKKVTRIVGSAAMGVWSPDGKRIAYMGAGEGRAPDLYLCDADGKRARQLIQVKDDLICGPQWSVDGKQIYFTMLTKGKEGAVGGFHLHVISSNGGKSVPLTHEGTMNFIGTGSDIFVLIGADPKAH